MKDKLKTWTAKMLAKWKGTPIAKFFALPASAEVEAWAAKSGLRGKPQPILAAVWSPTLREYVVLLGPTPGPAEREQLQAFHKRSGAPVLFAWAAHTQRLTFEPQHSAAKSDD